MNLTEVLTSDTMNDMRKHDPRNNLKIDPDVHYNLKLIAALTKRTMHQVIKDYASAELARLEQENTRKASK